eukprot:scaffold781_cov394-Prasinococcus_capsulatus_cf.AAC.21
MCANNLRVSPEGYGFLPDVILFTRHNEREAVEGGQRGPLEYVGRALLRMGVTRGGSDGVARPPRAAIPCAGGTARRLGPGCPVCRVAPAGATRELHAPGGPVARAPRLRSGGPASVRVGTSLRVYGPGPTRCPSEGARWGRVSARARGGRWGDGPRQQWQCPAAAAAAAVAAAPRHLQQLAWRHLPSRLAVKTSRWPGALRGRSRSADRVRVRRTWSRAAADAVGWRCGPATRRGRVPSLVEDVDVPSRTRRKVRLLCGGRASAPKRSGSRPAREPERLNRTRAIQVGEALARPPTAAHLNPAHILLPHATPAPALDRAGSPSVLCA